MPKSAKAQAMSTLWSTAACPRRSQSHDVSCNSQAGHMSGYSFERARRARSASVEVAPQQNALPDFSQIRPRPRLGNACLSCASSFLLMILQTFVNVLLHMFQYNFHIQKSSVREESEGLAGDSSHKDSKMTTSGRYYGYR